MASNCWLESFCAESLMVDRIIHPLNYFIVSARMPEAICLLYVMFTFFLCIDSDGGNETKYP